MLTERARVGCAWENRETPSVGARGADLSNSDHSFQLNEQRTFNHLRWLIAGLLFLSTVINYLDRQILSVVAPVLRQELKLRSLTTLSGLKDVVPLEKSVFKTGKPDGCLPSIKARGAVNCSTFHPTPRHPDTETSVFPARVVKEILA